MLTINIRSIMWGKYPFKAISVAVRKIAGLDRFKLVIEDKNYGGTYLVKTKNLTKCDYFKYGKGWVIDVEDYSVLEPFTEPREHDKMNIKDAVSNVIQEKSPEDIEDFKNLLKECMEQLESAK